MKDFSSQIIEIGIPELDAQHREILVLIRKAALLTQSSGKEKEIRQIIHEMTTYAISHFQFEESMMRSRGVSQLQAHQQLHQKYNQKVRELAAQTGHHQELSVTELVSWLWDWWTVHIQVCDREWALEYMIKSI